MSEWEFTGDNPIVAYTVGFEVSPHIDPTTLREISGLHQQISEDLPRKTDQQAFTFQVGQAVPDSTIGGVVFDELERDGTMKKQLSIMPPAIMFTTSRFPQWAEYWPLAARILRIVGKAALSQSSVTALVLAANNRFRWNGDVDSIDFTKLLRENCDYIAANIVKQKLPCHSFHGYTAVQDGPKGRRIDNVNFAVLNPERGVTPVDLNFNLRLLIDGPEVGYAPLFSGGEDSILAIAFKKLHVLNNNLFAKAIIPEICHKIPGVPEV